MAEPENHYGFDEGGDDDQSIVSVCVCVCCAVLIFFRESLIQPQQPPLSPAHCPISAAYS